MRLLLRPRLACSWQNWSTTRSLPPDCLKPNLPGGAGTRQAVISAIENGAQAPGGVMLARIAHALGGTLEIRIAA